MSSRNGIEMFGHLDAKLGAFVEKVKVLDAKEQPQSLPFPGLRDLRGWRSSKSFL